ncbi:MAG: hypothetical protein ACFFCW_42190 [Candidatus Hodarchaeota archaeon]
MVKAILEKLLFWPVLAFLLLIFSSLNALPQTDNTLLSIDTTSFILLRDEHGFRLQYDQKMPLPVPQEWLVPLDEVQRDTQSYISSFNYDEHVTAFPVGKSWIGLHLSSYEIQTEGAAQAAAGRDVFLVFNQKERNLHRGGLALGISKERVRSMGCAFATFLRFIIGDINNDGLTDIGIIREEIRCEETYDERKEVDVMTGPFYEKRPISWYVFVRDHWTQKADYNGKYPQGHAELPPIGLEKSPVDIVKNLYQMRIKNHSPGYEAEPPGGRRTIVLSYSDFGPQILAHELVGYEWYQWDSHGDSDPHTKYNVRVIVYKNIALKEVKKLYPVNKDKKQDYRYVEYNEALKYFNRHIKKFADLEKTDSKMFVESCADKLLSDFRITKRKIVTQLDQ